MITVKNLTKNFNSFSALKGINLGSKRVKSTASSAKRRRQNNNHEYSGRPFRLTKGSCLVNGKDVTKIKHPSELHIGYLPETRFTLADCFEILEYLGNSGGRRGCGSRNQRTAGLGGPLRRPPPVGGFSRE